MTDHPITPPPELVQQWIECCDSQTMEVMIEEVARWGADQELEACVQFLSTAQYGDTFGWYSLKEVAVDLRADRRPKPPSLKEQALDAWDRLKNEAWCEEIDGDLDFVRRALEQLDD